jgi:hypothetical protein
MKKITLLLFFIFTIFAFNACKKDSILTHNAENSFLKNASTSSNNVNRDTASNGCVAKVQTLIAGQTANAGNVTITNDATNIYVTYTTNSSYRLKATHIYVGVCQNIPLNNAGNPIVGNFPQQSTHNGIFTYTYTFPIASIGLGNCGCVAAHAVVEKISESGSVLATETAWGFGTRIKEQGNWAMKFEYCTCTSSL